MKGFNFKNYYLHDNKKLKIDKRLPKIIMPIDKLDMFIDWWNKDIRFQGGLPHSFEEGYFILDLNLITVNEDNYRELTRTIAKHYEVSVYKIRDLYDDFLKHLSHVTVHFKFLGSNRVLLNIYSFEDDLISMVNFEYTDTGESPEINFKPLSSDDFGVGESFGSDDYMENLYFNISCLWATGMWYLATTTNTKKYYSETKSDIVTSRHKNVVNVSSTKSIITPIYDLTKIKYVKTEKLIARRQGWTYSHSFQVHGHYRHYKDGRVIFIKPFIKGKGKEFMSQTINLVPNA